MLKQTHTYKDWNGKTVTKVLWFNLTQTELTENMHLLGRYEALNQSLNDGASREVTPYEIREMLELVKTFMRLSYGERPDDDHFVKGKKVWRRFRQTAAYDSFLLSLFEDTDKGQKFLIGVLPSNLQAAAKEEFDRIQAKREDETSQASLPEAPADIPVLSTAPSVLEKTPEADVVEDPRPLYQRENREPTKAELIAMTTDEVVEAMRWKVNLQK